MIGVRFTRQAEAGILSVHDDTIEAFGTRQWIAYDQGLRTALRDLQSDPFLGADRSSVKAGVRRLLFQRHVIYYRADPQEIVILRILGIRQDPGRHL